MSFEAANPTERPDPTRYLHKREGSPGGLKPAKASPKGSQAGLIPVGRDSPGSPTGSRRQGCSLFRAAYERDSLPVRVDQARPGKNGLRWTADLATLDLHFYLPLFVDGLLETQVVLEGLGAGGREQALAAGRAGQPHACPFGVHARSSPTRPPALTWSPAAQEPFCMLARRGVEELIAGCEPGRLLPVIPQVCGRGAGSGRLTAPASACPWHARAIQPSCHPPAAAHHGAARGAQVSQRPGGAGRPGRPQPAGAALRGRRPRPRPLLPPAAAATGQVRWRVLWRA